MPTVTLDTFLACSLMLILALSAMLSVPKIVQSHIDGLQGQEKTGYYLQLIRNILLRAGDPIDWGSHPEVAPTIFGLAEAGTRSALFFDLDIDKVTRLNPENEHAINYAQIFTAIGVRDVSWEIVVKPLFEISVSLASTEQLTGGTRYTFTFLSQRAGQPVACDMSCFVFAADFTEKKTASTDSDGKGVLVAELPFTVNGTAALVTIAKSAVNPSIVSYNVHVFSHNAPALPANASLTRLSPLNYSLTVEHGQADVEIAGAWCFSFDYNFSLNKISEDAQETVYEIPRLADSGPILLLVACSNASCNSLEWVSYPQVPLQIGSEPQNSSIAVAGSFTDLVAVRDAIYECIITVSGPA